MARRRMGASEVLAEAVMRWMEVVESSSLLVGRPKGTLNGKLADQMVEFIEIKEVENERGFHRFCDLSGIDGIQIGLSKVEELAARRSSFNPNKFRVKSAFLAPNPLARAIVELYRALLRSPRLTVRAFDSLEEAAHWLGVPPRKLRA